MSRAEPKPRLKEGPEGSSRSGQRAGRRQEQPMALPGLARPRRSPRHSQISRQHPHIMPFAGKNRLGEQ